MPPSTRLFTNRRRANSFGGAAQRYDAYRPDYPDALIDDLLAPGVRRVLDVGAGTGHLSRQIADRGCELLAVEPDERMATIARGKGIQVEIGTFEDWDAADRRFDLVTFAASFHWVDPEIALPKVADSLEREGRLALLWNRLHATRPLHVDVEDVFGDYFSTDAMPRHDGTGTVVDALSAAGFTAVCTEYPRTLTYSRDQWLELLFTYSSFITLAADAALDLRNRLTARIGDRDLTIQGDSLGIVARPG